MLLQPGGGFYTQAVDAQQSAELLAMAAADSMHMATAASAMPMPVMATPVFVANVEPRVGDSNSRWAITSTQRKVLERTYRTHPYPVLMLREQLGRDLNVTPRQVQIWFQNRRCVQPRAHCATRHARAQHSPRRVPAPTPTPRRQRARKDEPDDGFADDDDGDLGQPPSAAPSQLAAAASGASGGYADALVGADALTPADGVLASLRACMAADASAIRADAIYSGTSLSRGRQRGLVAGVLGHLGGVDCAQLSALRAERFDAHEQLSADATAHMGLVALLGPANVLDFTLGRVGRATCNGGATAHPGAADDDDGVDSRAVDAADAAAAAAAADAAAAAADAAAADAAEAAAAAVVADSRLLSSSMCDHMLNT
jgi:hypothetical protein